ncbi:LOW QUALITY PROTEIN: large ribosomal subunit protein eL15-like [Ctenodactylus gundi]
MAAGTVTRKGTASSRDPRFSLCLLAAKQYAAFLYAESFPCQATVHGLGHTPHPLAQPDKIHRLGYKAKQGYVVYEIPVHCGGRKCPVPKGATSGKPAPGVKQLQFVRSLQSVAEATWWHCGALRVTNSYWVGEDSTGKFFQVMITDPFHKATRRNPDTQWITKPVHKHRDMCGLASAGCTSCGHGKGHKFHHNIGGSRRAAWRSCNTIQLHYYN